MQASTVAAHGLSCSPSRPGFEPASSVLAGGFFTTEPWGKPCSYSFVCCCLVQLFATSWTHSSPDSLVHGISQERILEWFAISLMTRSLLPFNMLICHLVITSWKMPIQHYLFFWRCFYRPHCFYKFMVIHLLFSLLGMTCSFFLSLSLFSSLKFISGDFPSGPVAKTQSSQCRGPGFNPWSGS